MSELERRIGNYEIREKEYNDDSVKMEQIICKLAKNQHLTGSDQKEIDNCIRCGARLAGYNDGEWPT